MDKRAVISMVVVSLFLIVGGVVIAIQAQTPVMTGLNDFAKCLSQKGATMYGAYWCPHCQNTKKTFGDSFQYINYVECTTQSQKCEDAKVTGYPTWTFSNGTRLEGEQTMEKLSQVSSCPLPQK